MVLQAEILDPYAVIDGKILAANPWEGDQEYDYAAQDWYQNAIEEEGQIVLIESQVTQ